MNYVSDRQAVWTAVIASCGHETQARLSLDPAEAAYEIFTLKSQPCIACAVKQRRSTRSICWSDVNGGR